MPPSVPPSPMSPPHEEKNHMTFRVEVERESDGRWLAEIIEMPGVLAYGPSATEAGARVQALVLRVVADQLAHGETGPDLLSISFTAA